MPYEPYDVRPELESRNGAGVKLALAALALTVIATAALIIAVIRSAT
jgi:hypothetical protein